MPEYIVYERDTGNVVYAYTADTATDFPEYPFQDFSHVVKKPEAQPTPSRDVSGVSYLRRFSQDERIAIRNAAKESPKLDDYLKLLDITIAQGGVVNLDDADTIAAVNMLELAGLIAPGRAAEVLA
jgi:hypothetical protein